VWANRETDDPETHIGDGARTREDRSWQRLGRGKTGQQQDSGSNCVAGSLEDHTGLDACVEQTAVGPSVGFDRFGEVVVPSWYLTRE
jgi:hypothetical protein